MALVNSILEWLGYVKPETLGDLFDCVLRVGIGLAFIVLIIRCMFKLIGARSWML